jgi:hypothetical protein
MTDPELPEEPQQKPARRKIKWSEIPFNRVVLWVLVGGFGIYLIATGIVGLLAKSR